MVKLYTFVFEKIGGDMHKKGERDFWMGFHLSYDQAFKQAREIVSEEFRCIFFSEMSLWECIYLLPFFNSRVGEEKK